MEPTAPPPQFDRWEIIVLTAVVVAILLLAGWATSYARRRERDAREKPRDG
ncbi:MAG TPA: hypothetical protein PLZ36_13390 [Armatimonadota bacterium]|nr:hypothetical protein [Armatimonadota bacterium]